MAIFFFSDRKSSEKKNNRPFTFIILVVYLTHGIFHRVLQFFFSPNKFLGEGCLELPNRATSEKNWCISIAARVEAVCNTRIARITVCVLINNISRRLPLQLQCSYQGQWGDVSQSERGNYKTCF